jgi:hypothetical protein
VKRSTTLKSLAVTGGLAVVDAADGWPGTVTYASPDTAATVTVALYASPVSKHGAHRPELKIMAPDFDRSGREKVAREVLPVRDLPTVVLAEKEVTLPDGRLQTVMVAIPGSLKYGDETRWNLTFFEEMLQAAATTGWTVYNRRQQHRDLIPVHAFVPALLPTYLDMVCSGVETLPRDVITTAVASAGLLEAPPPDESDADRKAREDATRERVLKSVTKVFRDGRFAGRQRKAYGGACAMCGGKWRTNQGAHIYPVGSGRGSDHVSNGWHGCLLHHSAFDAHQIYIDPNTLEIVLHDEILESVTDSPMNGALVANTYAHLAGALNAADRVDPEWLLKRYHHFSDGEYDWVPAARARSRVV